MTITIRTTKIKENAKPIDELRWKIKCWKWISHDNGEVLKQGGTPLNKDNVDNEEWQLSGASYEIVDKIEHIEKWD